MRSLKCGNEAKLLTDEEIKTHDLFAKLNSKKLLTAEDEEDDAELKYLTFLRNIRDNDKQLFEKIKRLPKKARTARAHNKKTNQVITFFRKGKLRKVFQTNGSQTEEVDFFEAAKILEATPKTKKEKIGEDFYKQLNENKKAFDKVFENEADELASAKGGSHEARFTRTIKAIIKAKEFTEDDEEYLYEVLTLLRDGALPKATIKKIIKQVKGEINPLKILAKIRAGIAPEFFQKTFITSAADTTGPKEVILSEYLVGGNN